MTKIDLSYAHLTDAQKIAFSSVALATEQAKKAAEYVPLVRDPPPTPKRKTKGKR